MNKVINLSIYSYIVLFLSGFGCTNKYLFPNSLKYKKLINLGNKKISEEMNIGRIIKELRKLKIINEKILMNPEI